MHLPMSTFPMVRAEKWLLRRPGGREFGQGQFGMTDDQTNPNKRFSSGTTNMTLLVGTQTDSYNEVAQLQGPAGGRERTGSRWLLIIMTAVWKDNLGNSARGCTEVGFSKRSHQQLSSERF